MFFDIYPSLYNIPYWVYNILSGDKKMENKKIMETLEQLKKENGGEENEKK